MKKVRSTWTDSRLDGLNDRVDGLSDRLSELSREVRSLDERLTGRIDALQQTIIQVGGGLFAAFVALLAAIIGLIITQI
jgi:uncharacterized protein YoxC